MLEVLISGKVRGKPEQRQSAKATAYTRCRVAVTTSDCETILASVVAFGPLAEQVAALSDGDAVSVAGSAKLTHWRDRMARPASGSTWSRRPCSRSTPSSASARASPRRTPSRGRVCRGGRLRPPSTTSRRSHFERDPAPAPAARDRARRLHRARPYRTLDQRRSRRLRARPRRHVAHVRPAAERMGLEVPKC